MFVYVCVCVSLCILCWCVKVWEWQGGYNRKYNRKKRAGECYKNLILLTFTGNQRKTSEDRWWFMLIQLFFLEFGNKSVRFNFSLFDDSAASFANPPQSMCWCVIPVTYMFVFTETPVVFWGERGCGVWILYNFLH